MRIPLAFVSVGNRLVLAQWLHFCQLIYTNNSQNITAIRYHFKWKLSQFYIYFSPKDISEVNSSKAVRHILCLQNWWSMIVQYPWMHQQHVTLFPWMFLHWQYPYVPRPSLAYFLIKLLFHFQLRWIPNITLSNPSKSSAVDIHILLVSRRRNYHLQL